MLQVIERFAQIEREGTETDGTDADLERGPEEERLVAGDRVLTYIDKVFGGRGIEVIREQEGRILHYPLGRVSNHETPASVLGHDLLAGEGIEPPPLGAAVANGVWRNDQNGFVREQVTGLTEEAVIEELVRAFQRTCGPPQARITEQSDELPTRNFAQQAGDSLMRQKNSRKSNGAFTAVLFQGDLVGARIGSVTDTLTLRFGLPVLAVASIDTDGGGGGEGSAREAYGGIEAEEAARLAAYDLYEMTNLDVPAAKSEAELDVWASKRAKELRKLADRLEKHIAAKRRTALCNQAQKIRVAAERLAFGVHNWELDEEDKRWQAKEAKLDAHRETD